MSYYEIGPLAYVGPLSSYFIRLDGSNDHLISASINFPLGLSVPDDVQIKIGGTSDAGGTYGQAYIKMSSYAPPFDFVRDLQIGFDATSSGSNAAPSIDIQAGRTSGTSTGAGGSIAWTAGSATGTSGSGGGQQFSAGAGKGAGATGGQISMLGGSASGGATYGYVRVGISGIPGNISTSSSNARSSLYINQALEVDGITYGDGGILVGSTIFDANTTTSSVGIGQAGSASSTIGITSALTSIGAKALRLTHTLSTGNDGLAGIYIAPTLSFTSSANTRYDGISVFFQSSTATSGASPTSRTEQFGINAAVTKTSSSSSSTVINTLSGGYYALSDATTYSRTTSNSSVDATGFYSSNIFSPRFNDGGTGRTLSYRGTGSLINVSYTPVGPITGTLSSAIRGIWIEAISGDTAVANNTSTIYGIDVAGPTTGATAYGVNIGAASASTTAYGLAIAKPITASTIYQVALNGSGVGSGVYFNTPTTAGTTYIRSVSSGILNLGATTIRLDPLTSNGLVKTSGSDGTLSIAAAGTDYVHSISVDSPILNTGTAADPIIDFDFSTNNTWTGRNTWQNQGYFNAGGGLAFGDVSSNIPAGIFASTSQLFFDANTDESATQFTALGLSVDSAAQGLFYRYDTSSANQLLRIGYQDNLDVRGQGAGTQFTSLAISSSSGHIQLGEVDSSNTIDGIVEVRGDDFDSNPTPFIVRSGDVEPKNYFAEFRNGSDVALATINSNGSANFTNNIAITDATIPTLTLTSNAGDDWSIDNSSGTLRLTNVTDLTVIATINPTTYLLTYTGAITATSLNLTSTSNQIVLQSAGITTTLTESGTGSNKVQTFPDNTGTIANLNLAQTWTGRQIFTPSSDLYTLVGTSTTGLTGVNFTDGQDQLVVGRQSTATSNPQRAAVFTMAAQNTSNSSGAFAAINAFVGTGLSNTANLTSSTQGGGIKNRYVARTDGSGTVTQASAITALVTVQNGTITDGFAYHVEPITVASTRTLTRGGGLWVRSGVNSGTWGTQYGIRIDALSSATTNYQIALDGTGSTSGIAFNTPSAAAVDYIRDTSAGNLAIGANTTISAMVGATEKMNLQAGAGGYNIFRNGSGIFRLDGSIPETTSYELSIQSSGSAVYMEMLNSTGTGRGMFFGGEVISGTQSDFAIYNYDGNAAASGNYPIVLYGGWGSGGSGQQELARFDLTGGNILNDQGLDMDFRVEGDTLPYMIHVDASATTENIALLTSAAPNWQSMDGGIFLGNTTTAPTGNPTSGGFLYSESGALKWRGTGGTVTTIAPA